MKNKKFIMFIVLIAFIFLGVGFEVGSKIELNYNSKLNNGLIEDQAYGVMVGNFNYYYSMDLHKVSTILKDVSTLTEDNSSKKEYILGCIDSYMSMSPYYVNATRLLDQYLTNKILPLNFSDIMGVFNESKVRYLEKLRTAIRDSSKTIYTDDFRKNCNDIIDILKELNRNANEMEDIDYSSCFASIINCMDLSEFES